MSTSLFQDVSIYIDTNHNLGFKVGVKTFLKRCIGKYRSLNGGKRTQPNAAENTYSTEGKENSTADKLVTYS